MMMMMRHSFRFDDLGAGNGIMVAADRDRATNTQIQNVAR